MKTDANGPVKYLGDFINGRFVPVDKGDGEIKDISPSDLSDAIMTVPFKRDRMEEACLAAREAYLPWARKTQAERIAHLLKLKEVLDKNVEEMAVLISRDTGKPYWETLTEAKALSSKIDITVNYSLKLVAEERISEALPQVDGVVRHKSRGVMAVIGPFNFPVHLPNGHIIPSLLAGNTVVFKPSEMTSASCQFYAQLFEKAELPKGVFNMVHGDGEAGRKLVLNETVDGILFTGSYEVGLKIKQETLTHYWKILALEMGGKNATIVWSDADLNKAIYETLVGAFMSTGQRCACTSRVILHDRIADEFTERFYQAAKKLTIGHWSENVFMGPLINSGSVDKYVRFQEIANRENCENLMRGKVLDTKYKGHYVTPSIHLVKKFDPQSVYQKTEIFGPNVALYRSSDFSKALEIVNSTGYGLVASLFTKSQDIYQQALLEAKVGLLNLNRTTNGSSSRLPFGGMGKSGNDRPSAHYAIQYCTVPVSSLEDQTPFDATKMYPGISFEAV